MSERPRSILRAAAVTLIAALLLPAGTAQAESPWASHGAKVFDVMLLRPIGFSALIVGSVLFVPVALLTFPNGRESVETAVEILVTEPAHSVFQRPLGEF